jgi:hypothetical protein
LGSQVGLREFVFYAPYYVVFEEVSGLVERGLASLGPPPPPPPPTRPPLPPALPLIYEPFAGGIGGVGGLAPSGAAYSDAAPGAAPPPVRALPPPTAGERSVAALPAAASGAPWALLSVAAIAAKVLAVALGGGAAGAVGAVCAHPIGALINARCVSLVARKHSLAPSLSRGGVILLPVWINDPSSPNASQRCAARRRRRRSCSARLSSCGWWRW